MIEEQASSSVQTGEEENAASGKSAKKKILLIVICIVIAALVAAYLAVGIYFRDRFLPNTQINSIDCSGKTAAEVEEILKKEADGYTLTIKERGDKEETINGSDIDVELDFGDSVNQIVEEQNSFAWPMAFKNPQKVKLEQVVTYDEAALSSAVAALECADESQMTESTNAALTEYQAGTGYELTNAVFGTKLDTARLAEQIEESVKSLTTNLDLEAESYYEDPQYTEDSEEAQAMLAKANQYVNTTVTYTFGDSSEVLDGTTISGWLTIGDDLSVTLDQSKASEYVASLADTYNTYGKSKTLSTSYGSTVTVPGGNYGWKIDQDTTANALIGYLENGESYTGDVSYSQTAASHGSNDYGNTYVEINLTAQHLYFYKNGSLVVQSDFVSGNLSKGYDTPSGAYKLAYKQRDKTLRGADYATPVSFWMPFNGGIGLHDATWRSSFGGTIYKTSGSHGCINLPYSVAQTIYNSISAGDAVLCYTLSGTESKSSAETAADSVISAIDAIGTVTANSGGAISNARSAYDGLSSSAKKYVTNYGTLTAAESTYASLSSSSSEAQAVIDAINAIGTVTADSEGAISNARAQYDALSEAAKGYVSNYGTLQDAEAQYQALIGQ